MMRDTAQTGLALISRAYNTVRPSDWLNLGLVVSIKGTHWAADGARIEPALRDAGLRFQSGGGFLRTYLHEVQALGINRLDLNPCFNCADIEPTLKRLADDLLPGFAN
ncbi:MAG: hypothetical protein ACOH2H_06570 [Cypionkella sp.]